MKAIEIEALVALVAWYEQFQVYESSDLADLHPVFATLRHLGLGQQLPEKMEYAIYALADPRTKRIRYIGITNRPTRRYLEHLNNDETNVRKQEWIDSLKAHRLRPQFKILEIVAGLQLARQRETQWITACKAAGLDLLNIVANPPPLPDGAEPHPPSQQPANIPELVNKAIDHFPELPRELLQDIYHFYAIRPLARRDISHNVARRYDAIKPILDFYDTFEQVRQARAKAGF